MNKLYQRIKAELDRNPKLTQKGLAARMGLNPAAVNRMLHGRRNIMVDELPIIEAYLGVSLQGKGRSSSDAEEGLRLAPKESAWGKALPVYGLERKKEGSGREIIDWVIRHPALLGIQEGFALYVRQSDMIPRYEPGELVYVHPGRPPIAGRDCVIEFPDGRFLIRRFLHQDGTQVFAGTFYPEGQESFNLEEILGVYSIIGRG